MQLYTANETTNQNVWFDDFKVTFTPQLIVQENHYYPFGMTLKGIHKIGQPQHKFTYNGKEKQEEFGLNWLDYHARQYNSQIARFSAIDPLSDEYESFTPYHYVMNNPLIFIDPTGAFTVYYNDKGERIGEDEFGESDGRMLIVKNKDDIERIKFNSSHGRPTMGFFISDGGENILLPPLNIREAIGAAGDRQMSPNNNRTDEFKGDDPVGGRHEESLYYGVDKKTGEYKVVNFKPGAFLSGQQIQKGKTTYDTGDGPVDSDKFTWNYHNFLLLGHAHTHPSVVVKIGNIIFGNPSSNHHWPSTHDVRGAQLSDNERVRGGNPPLLRFIIAPGKNKVSIYNGDQANQIKRGQLSVKPMATMDLNVFRSKKK